MITLTAASEEFVPFLALFDALSPDALVEAVGDEAELAAAIEDFVLPSAGSYSVLVSGSNVSDRGDYQLTLESSAGGEIDDLDVAQITPGQSVEGEVTSRFGSETVFFGCVDQEVSFTLESEDFVPLLELFGPSGRDPLAVGEGSGALAQISAFTLPETGVYTLVAGGESVLARGAFTLAMLEAGSEPATATPTTTPTATPTPLPTFTPTPTPAPTATSQPSAILPQGIPIQVNGGDGDLLGEVFVNPGYMVSIFEEDDTLVVGERFYLELFVFDIREGLYNGAGIDYVEFIFDCPNDEQYVHREESPRYCSFSDDGGSCNVARLRSGQFFPGSSCEVVNDFYYVNITAYPTNPNLQPGNWNFTIRPEIP